MTDYTPKVERLRNNPIIRPNMDYRMGDNINGPSLIQVPDWVRDRLGKYYLYFGHHNGRYIRLAYADELEGPWRIHSEGVLSLEDSHFEGHIASPDVHVDHTIGHIRMYFHGSNTVTGGGTGKVGAQFTRVSISRDGLNFNADSELLANPYLRAFQWNGNHYAIAMPGVFYRSENGMSNFEDGPTLFTENMRHSAVIVDENVLQIFFTMVGDSPERIKLSTVDLSDDWMDWTASDPIDVLSPELPWEGSEMMQEPSKRGIVDGRVNQLRDPAIYEEDGRTYLLYSTAGESGIGIAELTF
jgi:hypothetical protein